MPRPADGWPALGAVLHRVLAGPAVDWLAPDTRHAAEVLLRRLRPLHRPGAAARSQA